MRNPQHCRLQPSAKLSLLEDQQVMLDELVSFDFSTQKEPLSEPPIEIPSCYALFLQARHKPRHSLRPTPRRPIIAYRSTASIFSTAKPVLRTPQPLCSCMASRRLRLNLTRSFPLLATKYHLIAPDYPGFGLSDAPSPTAYTYTFDHLAQTIE